MKHFVAVISRNTVKTLLFLILVVYVIAHLFLAPNVTRFLGEEFVQNPHQVVSDLVETVNCDRHSGSLEIYCYGAAEGFQRVYITYAGLNPRELILTMVFDKPVAVGEIQSFYGKPTLVKKLDDNVLRIHWTVRDLRVSVWVKDSWYNDLRHTVDRIHYSLFFKEDT